MPRYLAETFLPRGAAGDRRARNRATRTAAEALTRDGTTVRFAGSIYVPEDEICFYRFDAPSVGDVERIAERAGLRLLRVVVTLAVVLLTGCTTGPGVSPPPPSADAVTASPAQKMASSTMRPPAAPTSSPVTGGIYSANDKEIAELVTAAAGEAIPRLKGLNAKDPSQLEDLFVPLGTWIADQRTGVEAYTPSDCTAVAVARFVEGMDAYDDIRKRFLAWRDWGAHGNAFHPEAPRQAAALLDEALVELDARCTT